MSIWCWPINGTLRYRSGVWSKVSILALTLSGLSASAQAGAASTQILVARGHWAALKFGRQCVAEARPLPPAAQHQPQARAGFGFIGGRGEFHVRLSRMPRPGASVMLTVGDRPFLLLARGDWAWSSGPLQEAAILEAMRFAQTMRIEARDQAGRRFADRYALDGAPTAIDAAAAACAGKI